MKKLTLTVLHKLPNRVRFKVSHEIIDTKKFFETIKVGAKSTALRYNRTIIHYLKLLTQRKLRLMK